MSVSFAACLFYFSLLCMQVELAHGGRGPSSNDRRGGYGGGGGSGGRFGISRHSEFRGLFGEYLFPSEKFIAVIGQCCSENYSYFFAYNLLLVFFKLPG